MHLHQANTLERIEPAGIDGRSEVPTQPAARDLGFSSPNGDEILALLKPDDRGAPIGWSQAHWLRALD